MAQVLKCPAFIAAFSALYCGMSICCQEDLSVVQWEGICRVCPILRRLNELGGFAHMESTRHPVAVEYLRFVQNARSLEKMPKFPR